jgi:lysophospholipase L1-like esterase
VVNLGHDGNLAWNVLERLDDAIDHRPSPDVVTVLIGTNDVNATHDETWQQYYRRGQHLPQRADLDFYRDSLDTILRRLRTETTARVAVLDLPPLGEDLDAPANRMVDVYRGVLREVAAAHDVPVLPLHERLVALFPPGHTPPPFHMSLTGIGIATAERLVLRRSWDDVSRRAGLAVLTDHVHLNDRAAGVVADLIGEFLAEQG